MKILITGAAGQLGRELQRSLACLGEVQAFDRSTLDLANPDQLRDTVRRFAPSAIINAAAWIAVDKAETKKMAQFRPAIVNFRWCNSIHLLRKDRRQT